jgi:hypothetical protein
LVFKNPPLFSGRIRDQAFGPQESIGPQESRHGFASFHHAGSFHAWLVHFLVWFCFSILSCSAERYEQKIRSVLCDQDPSVMSATLCIFEDGAVRNAKVFFLMFD